MNAHRPYLRGLAATAILLAATPVLAGNLDPSGPPAPTMQSLDDRPGAWSRQLPANDTADPCNSSRFKCVLPTTANPTGEAVLDRETGLVWERTPSGASAIYPWTSGINGCALNANAGGRRGWRLPTAEELASLVNVQGGPLPAGSPFTGPAPCEYWTTTTNDPAGAFVISVKFPGTAGACLPSGFLFKAALAAYWCVRGGHGHDGQ